MIGEGPWEGKDVDDMWLNMCLEGGLRDVCCEYGRQRGGGKTLGGGMTRCKELLRRRSVSSASTLSRV